MFDHRASVRYAKPLIDLSISKGIIEDVFKDVNLFLDTCKSNYDFSLMLKNPIVPLNKKVDILKDIPSLKIEISGHTDNIGEESYNLLLSQRRADAVVLYLVKSGIDPARLTAKGYGESRPVISNETEDGRASNRRTEFEIIDN